MLAREKRRRARLVLITLASLLAALLLLCVRPAGPAAIQTLLDGASGGGGGGGGPWVASPPDRYSSSPSTSPSPITDGSVIRPSDPGTKLLGLFGEVAGFAPPSVLRPGGGHPFHVEIFSVSTRDRKYFQIRLGGRETSNPSIIPHPSINDTWIVVAADASQPSVELMCNAKFIDGVLTCVGADGTGLGDPSQLPLQPCEGQEDPGVPNHNVGPYDARAFYGPDRAYVLAETPCSGQELREFVAAADRGPDAPAGSNGGDYLTMVRHEPLRGAAGNAWFLFWAAADGARHVHHAVSPRRSFARLYGDGSAGRELGRGPARRDDACLARYYAGLDGGSLGRATNSLAVTLCRRADAGCRPDGENTFNFVIFHHVTTFEGHVTYHPYAVVFRDRSPFEIWAVGTRPIWISGRKTHPDGDTEKMHISSMSWRDMGQRYHGFADDVLFLAFGIEDKASGGMDVYAGDLLATLGLC